MSTKRAFKVEELSNEFVERFLHTRKEEIAEAVANGGVLEIEESSFSDPGPDFSRILLDGKEVGYIPGY